MNTEKKVIRREGGISIPLLFFFCILFYNPTLFFMPSTPSYMAFFPAGVFSLLAIAFVFLKPASFFSTFREMNPYARLALGLFTLVALIQYFQHPEYRLIHLAECLVWISVPFCVFVFYSVFRKTLFPFLALFSVWQMIFCVLLSRDRGIWGITGNINFTAALQLLCVPFLLFYGYRFLHDRKKFSRRVSVLLLSPVAACGILIFLNCSSRGAFLGLFCVTVLFLFLHLPNRGRRILFYACLLCCICGSVLFVRYGVDRFSALAANEDRPYFYMGTVRMIADFPLLGVGGVSFENAFVKYKPPEYFFARYATDRISHPHNQELFMLSSFGIFAYLAWIFLLYVPVILLLLRIWRREKVDPEIKICLFVFLCCVLHSQLDMIFYFFPTYLIMLMMMGLFWHEVFRKEKDSVALPRKPVLMLFRLSGVLVLFFACFSVAKPIYSSWMTWRLMSVPMSRAERLMLIQRISAFAPDEYKQNYALMVLAENLNAPEVVLKVSNIMLGSHIPNYGHIHFFRGTAFARLGRLPDAYESYRIDSENYPLTVRPYLRMITVARLMGRNDLLPSLEAALNERLKLREINPQMLEAIRKDPFYDMRPWWIPKEQGGPGGYVTFPDGRKVRWD